MIKNDKKLITPKDEMTEFLLYKTPTGMVKVEVFLYNENIWLTQEKIAELFLVDRSVITKHLKNIYENQELEEISTSAKIAQVQKEGDRKVKRDIKFYNLDAIISVGYRVNSKKATQFRIWATKILKEYIIKGFAVDDERLKENSDGNYWKELLDRIRDIRSSEKVLYRQILDLYATSLDYNPKSLESVKFFKIVQNKLHYAAHGSTAAEVIAERANAGKPFMGLLVFSGNNVSKKDISIAKNYLSEKELKILNNIVSAYFDMAEVKAMNQEPMNMSDWIIQLDKLIELFNKKVLTNAGVINHKQAMEKADIEYKKYQQKTLSGAEKDFLESVKELEKKIKKKV